MSITINNISLIYFVVNNGSQVRNHKINTKSWWEEN